MAGIIGIYGLVVSVLISDGLTQKLPLFTSFIQLGAGLPILKEFEQITFLGQFQHGAIKPSKVIATLHRILPYASKGHIGPISVRPSSVLAQRSGSLAAGSYWSYQGLLGPTEIFAINQKSTVMYGVLIGYKTNGRLVEIKIDMRALESDTEAAEEFKKMLPTITVDGIDVSGPIREQAVTSAVSAVSAVPEIRQRLVREQRDIIGDGGIVVEGRDIGTAVAPDAPVKVYLTADPAARAERRSAEQAGTDVAATQADLLRRDTFDSGRATSPLAMAADAHHIDTTPYSLDEVVDQVVALVERAAVRQPTEP